MKSIVLSGVFLAFIYCGSNHGKGTDQDAAVDISETVGDASVVESVDVPLDSVEKDTNIKDTKPSETSGSICNLYTQTGCELDDGLCVFDNETGEPICTAKGTIPLGGNCGGIDTCEQGDCVNLGAAGPKCYQYCKPIAGATLNPYCKYEGKSRVCIKIADQQWGVCQLPPSAFDTCNLVEQNCQNSNAGCYFSNLTWEPICLKAGIFKEGEPCSQENDCAKGYVCVNSKCYQICNLNYDLEPKCKSESANCLNYYGIQNAGTCME